MKDITEYYKILDSSSTIKAAKEKQVQKQVVLMEIKHRKSRFKPKWINYYIKYE